MTPYADIMWWLEQIRRQVNINPMQDPLSGCASAQDVLEAARDNYSNVLSDIAYHTESPDQARGILFLSKAFRKWRLPLQGLDVRMRGKEAIDGFIQRASDAGDTSFIPTGAISYLMRNILASWLPCCSSELPAGKFGPGAVYERLSHVRRYMRLARWIRTDDHWPDVPATGSEFQRSVARLCAVPKDWYRDRLITVETAYNSWAQQAARSAILESIHAGPLRGTAMDLGYTDGQLIQRRLALRASRSGKYATLDLKDASDRISWDAVRAVFPSWIVQILEVTRASMFETGGQLRTNHIFAGMGNATTFPIETLFFSAYVRAIAIHESLPRFVSTFGDDIICHSKTAAFLIEHGQAPFFCINRDKSFVADAALRESCGIFAWKGVDITCPRIDGYDISTWDGRLAVADLHRRCMERGDYLLASGIAELHLLPNWPLLVDSYPSLSDPSTEYDAEPPSRWNHLLSRKEYRLPIIRPRGRLFPLWDEIAKIRNDPDASVFLNLALLGQLTSVVRHGRPYALITERDSRNEVQVRWVATTRWEL